MHFKKSILIALVLLAGLILGMFFSLGRYGKSDQIAYQKLIQGGDEVSANETHTSRQRRLGSHKDLYVNRQGERLQLRLDSVQAELVFERREGQLEIIEQMQQVKCCLQEERFYLLPDGRELKVLELADMTGVVPVQRVVILEAERASYYFQDNQFKANNVKVVRYLAAGHDFEFEPKQIKVVATGTAQNITFVFGKELNFSGEGFQAKINGDEHEVVSVGADHIDDDGKSMKLSGNVNLDHSLGHMSANQAELWTAKEDGKEQIDRIELSGDVRIGFRQGGRLLCSQAKLDKRSLSGWFCGDDKQEFVTYEDYLLGKKQEKIPLKISSKQMAMKLIPTSSVNAKFSINSIGEISAQDNVKINYRNLTVNGDQAIYVPGQPNSGLSMCANEQGGVCQILTHEGDQINAKRIDIDTIKKQITFTEPDGVLAPKDGKPSIEFSANTLLWSEIDGILTLKDNVEVGQEGIGKVQSIREIRLFQSVVDGSKSLRAIESEGGSILTYNDSTQSHTIKCSGPLKVDHKKMETRLFSQADMNGKIAEDKQVHFQDAKGTIYADRALVKYSYVDRRVVPTKIVLLGNVKIMNRLPASNEGVPNVLQYLLAERVEFFPQTKEMIFSAKPGARVLFFDKTNNLQVSAPILKIVRDQATKKESIQGLGDVRFSFVDHEIEQLRRRFSLDKS